ncbi:hypothetical protein J7K27_04125 [Candidatus Bathyarchaeota archaeon]|nr:hypothetical protein [Candidatus Bathyarchaeota archaeon]
MDPELYKRLRMLEKLEKLREEALKLEKSEEKPQTKRKSPVSFNDKRIAELEENFWSFADVYELMLRKAGDFND